MTSATMIGAAIGAVAGLIGLAEAGLRLAGALEFPLWSPDPDIGYMPRPNQRGRLLHRADWVFNALSMGVAAPFHADGPCVLLVGDSLVYSNSRTPQARKPGPLLQARLGVPVWPISAGSWGLLNELRYLEAHPQVLACSAIVIVSNSGDLQGLSVWRSMLTHPHRRPVCAVLYALGRLGHRLAPPREPPAADGPAPPWAEALDRLLSTYQGRLLFVLYPDRNEMRSGLDRFGPLRDRLAGRAEVLDLRPHWSVDAYRDGMHPKPEWERRLVERIAAHLERRRAA